MTSYNQIFETWSNEQENRKALFMDFCISVLVGPTVCIPVCGTSGAESQVNLLGKIISLLFIQVIVKLKQPKII